MKLKKYYAEKFSETTGIEIKTQNWGGNRQLSMEGIPVEYFPIQFIFVAIKKSEFYSYITEKMNKMHVLHMLICFIY